MLILGALSRRKYYKTFIPTMSYAKNYCIWRLDIQMKFCKENLSFRAKIKLYFVSIDAYDSWGHIPILGTRSTPNVTLGCECQL